MLMRPFGSSPLQVLGRHTELSIADKYYLEKRKAKFRD